jgi:hypothetical protein
MSPTEFAVSLIACAAVTAGVVELMHRSSLFEQLRTRWQTALASGQLGALRGFYYEMMSCPQCLGQWVSGWAAFVVVGQVHPLSWTAAVYWLVLSLAARPLAALILHYAGMRTR